MNDYVRQIISIARNIGLNEEVTPPFFDVDKSNPKKTSAVSPKKGDIGKNLNRGVNDKMLGDFDDDDYIDASDRDVKVLEFRDARHFEEAMKILAEDPEIGHPTYERGIDSKSIIFHLWKADESMKKRINKAISLLKKYGLVQDTKYHPHYRKR